MELAAQSAAALIGRLLAPRTHLGIFLTRFPPFVGTENSLAMAVKYLNDPWRFWLVLVTRSGGGRQYVIEEIVTVQTLENFVQFYASIPLPSRLKNTSQQRPSIALFRQDIKPAWEDPRNEHGGAFSFMVRNGIDEVWEELVFYLIGGDFDKKVGPGNKCHGIVVCPSKSEYRVELWMEKIISQQEDLYARLSTFVHELKSAQDSESCRIQQIRFEKFNVCK